jgi:mannose-6-phosphate isomerase-like protein (cupin superfamily)
LSARYLTSHAAITISDGIGVHRTYIQPGEGHVWSAATNKLRYCEVISGKLDVQSEGKVVSIGRGGLFVIHPKMAVSAENPGSAVVELSCHTHTTCLAVPDRSRR